MHAGVIFMHKAFFQFSMKNYIDIFFRQSLPVVFNQALGNDMIYLHDIIGDNLVASFLGLEAKGATPCKSIENRFGLFREIIAYPAYDFFLVANKIYLGKFICMFHESIV